MNNASRLNPTPVDPRYAGIYAHGVAVPGNTRVVYVSGQVGVDADGRLAHGFESQCDTALDNVAAVLATANLDFNDIVKMTFYITDRRDMDALVAVRRHRLGGVSPAITTVVVNGLVEPDWLIEVEVLAHGPSERNDLPALGRYTDLGY